jgi:hypothetical protein
VVWSGAATLFEFLTAATGAWLVSPNFLPGDGRRRDFTQHASEIRHLVKRQSGAAEVRLRLLA